MKKQNCIRTQRSLVLVITLLVLMMGALHEAMAQDQEAPVETHSADAAATADEQDSAYAEDYDAKPAAKSETAAAKNSVEVNKAVASVAPAVGPAPTIIVVNQVVEKKDDKKENEDPKIKHGNAGIGLGYTRFYKERGGEEYVAKDGVTNAATATASAYVWTANDPILFQFEVDGRGYRGDTPSGKTEWGFDSAMNSSLSGIFGLPEAKFAFGGSFFGDVSKYPGATWDANAGFGLEAGGFLSNGHVTAMASGMAGGAVNITDFMSGAAGAHARLGGRFKLMHDNNFYLSAEFYRKFNGATVNAPSLYGSLYSDVKNLKDDLFEEVKDSVTDAINDRSVAGAGNAVGDIKDTFLNTIDKLGNTTLGVGFSNWVGKVSVGGNIIPHVKLEANGAISDAPIVVRKNDSTLQMVPALNARGTAVLSVTLD